MSNNIDNDVRAEWNGRIPPVGVEVEILIIRSGNSKDWRKGTLRHIYDGGAWITLNDDLILPIDKLRFRPIASVEELAMNEINEALLVLGYYGNHEKIGEEIIARISAGVIKSLKFNEEGE